MPAAKRILIADDEPNIVVALEFLLQKSGFDVQVARNGEEVLQKVAQSPPDLVLLDIMMPVVSGYEVCRRLRERPDCRDLKIVILSARGRETEVQRGLAAGANLYMIKPFSTRELVDRIRALLGR